MLKTQLYVLMREYPFFTALHSALGIRENTKYSTAHPVCKPGPRSCWCQTGCCCLQPPHCHCCCYWSGGGGTAWAAHPNQVSRQTSGQALSPRPRPFYCCRTEASWADSCGCGGRRAEPGLPDTPYGERIDPGYSQTRGCCSGRQSAGWACKSWEGD